MPQASIYQNGGWIKYPDRVTTRTFFRADDRYTRKGTLLAGQVIKGYSFLESIKSGANAGKLQPHRGLSEATIVKFNLKSGNATLALTSTETMILGGLTFTAGTSGITPAQLALAWAYIADGVTAAAATTAAAANGITAAMGTFTAGTFSGWNTYPAMSATDVDCVDFRGSTYLTNASDLSASGTGTAPTLSNVQGTTSFNLIAGISLYDAIAGVVDPASTTTLSSSVDTEITIYTEASFWAEALVWAVNPLDDLVYDSLGNGIAPSGYNRGVYGPDVATTRRLMKQFVEQSEFANLGFISESPTPAGTTYYV